MAVTVRAARLRLVALLASVWAWRAEILLSAATLAGWAFVTAFVASLTSARAWTLSAGLLCLSLCGWKYLGRLAWFGLYALTRDEKGARRG